MRAAAILRRLSFGVLLPGAVLGWYELESARPWVEPAPFGTPGIFVTGFFVLWVALPYGLMGLVGWLLARRCRSAATGLVFLAFSALLVALGLLGYSTADPDPEVFIVPLFQLVVAAAASLVLAGVAAVASFPLVGLAILVCWVAVLYLGIAVPRFVIGDGVERYSGEERTFARWVLEYDQMLQEWPFPIDPTVARRVTEVNRATGVHGLTEGEECAPDVTQTLAAEVVHYGPFGVPTGKNVFRCDLARTISYPHGVDPDGALSQVLFFALMFAVLVSLLAAPVVFGALLLGGALLLQRGEGRGERVVGMVAVGESIVLLMTAEFLLAYYVYETYRLYGLQGLWPFP